MMVNFDQWCAAIANFNCYKRLTRCVSFSNNINSSLFYYWCSIMLYMEEIVFIILALPYIFTFLLYYGDIEWMLGPKRMKPKFLYIYHWKLNSISADSFQKLDSYKHRIPFINMILFVYLKHTQIWLHFWMIILFKLKAIV